MPTLSRKLKVKEIYAEWDRIEAGLRVIDVPVDRICLLDITVQSLAYGLVNRAGALGIQADVLSMQQIETEDWICDPIETEVFFGFPNEDHLIWFRTFVL